MPNITLYVKESDLPLVDAARKKLGDSLSSSFVDCLRERIKAADPKTPRTRHERIEIAVGNPKITKTFFGEWLIPNDRLAKVAGEKGEAVYRIALTRRGRFLAKIVQLTPHLGTPEMHLFDSLQEMREATTPNGTNLVPEIFVAEAQEALVRGTHYVELDI